MEISASFTLTGIDLDPDKLTAKVGVVPTKTWRKGDLINSRAIVRYQENGWSLQSNLDQSEPLANHIQSVLEQLQPNWAVFVEMSQQHSAEVDCVVYTEGQTPEIHFDKTILRQVAQLNAEIDVDLYILPEEPMPETPQAMARLDMVNQATKAAIQQ